MARTNATILIPDISGFTEFMSATELSHGSQAISILMDAIVGAVGGEYEISNVEGDAVLMVRKGSAPSKKEILDTCFKIFNAFHFQRKWLHQHAICPCKACLEIRNLKFKFVAHHGPLDEMKVGHFATVSGTEVIIAHRLLKNSVPSDEYLLLTEKLLKQAADAPGATELEWVDSSDEYGSIGKVNYRFALLDAINSKVPDPPPLQNDYATDATPFIKMTISANFRDVYMVMMNIPGRNDWIPGLQKVDQDRPEVFAGSVHYCTFDNYKAIISPLRMTASNEEIFYAESCRIDEMDVSIIHEFVFRSVNDNCCMFSWRFLNAGNSPLADEMNSVLLVRMKQIADSLKAYCEKDQTILAADKV
jgi:class 3 adenylate cyclase